MSDRTSAWLPGVLYPAVMILAFVLHASLQRAGAPLLAATYGPVLVTAVLVTWLEWVLPYRLEWRPERGEVKTDLSFMLVVQLVFPPLVGFAFTYALIQPAAALHLPFSRLWPHGLAIWLQAALMILVVDFFRYWIHRWEHENDTLWRLHSVHHSVEQLYWLNTARFHPIEKTLQMVADSLPFLLMAVDERVLALYYVAYATNGFFQHCNIDLRYGPLNYIVGSAETHRWHHSRVPRESNANYGSTVAVWDVLFGTWYLPRDRAISDLGLQDLSYPRSFLRLLRAPFKSARRP